MQLGHLRPWTKQSAEANGLNHGILNGYNMHSGRPEKLEQTLSVAVRRFRALHQLRHGHIADSAGYSRDR